MSKDRETYLKFKPMADDLRKAESWCELDGVLNRYQTVKNLYKMGYRKQSEVIDEIVSRLKEKLYTIPTVYNAHFSRMLDDVITSIERERR